LKRLHPAGHYDDAEQRAAVDACIERMREGLALSSLQRTGVAKARYHRGLRLPENANAFDAVRWAEAIRGVLPMLETIPRE
jgi:hypothetical protein